jgi:hypothetical protein
MSRITQNVPANAEPLIHIQRVGIDGASINGNFNLGNIAYTQGLLREAVAASWITALSEMSSDKAKKIISKLNEMNPCIVQRSWTTFNVTPTVYLIGGMAVASYALATISALDNVDPNTQLIKNAITRASDDIDLVCVPDLLGTVVVPGYSHIKTYTRNLVRHTPAVTVIGALRSEGGDGLPLPYVDIYSPNGKSRARSMNGAIFPISSIRDTFNLTFGEDVTIQLAPIEALITMKRIASAEGSGRTEEGRKKDENDLTILTAIQRE